MTESFLELRKGDDGTLEIFDPRFPKSQPFRIPWNDPRFLKKISDSIARRTLALRAVLGSEKSARVLDTTLGLGEDTLLFLTAGCQVTGIERNPVLQKLWLDAAFRMHESENWSARAKNFQLLAFDAISFLEKLEPGTFDVLYADPMFPRKGKTALPRRELWTLRALTGDDSDAEKLVQAALQCFDRGAVNRVVIKQPDLGGLELGRKPSGEIKGKTVLFQIFAR